MKLGWGYRSGGFQLDLLEGTALIWIWGIGITGIGLGTGTGTGTGIPC